MDALIERIRRLTGPQRDALARQLDAVADADRPASGRTRLVAYVTADDPIFFDEGEVRRHVSERLPEWMVPDIAVIDEMPRTPNGKVDVNALPDPDGSGTEMDAYAPPRSDRERALCEIWESVMGAPRIGVHDNFFEIGGDSILSIQVVARMRQAGFRTAPDLLFRHQTVAELAAAVERTSESRTTAIPEAGAVPLTPIQHWFFDQDFERPEHWHQAALIGVPDNVRPPDLEKALNLVVRRHDVFRLRFDRTAAGWMSAYVPAADVSLTLDEVHATSSTKDERSVHDHIHDLVADGHASADLASPPLVRAVLVSGIGSRKLYLAIHHLIVDPVSWQIILEDLETAFDAVSRGMDPEFPARTTPFRAWGEAVLLYAASPAAESEVDYWLKQVARPSALRLRSREAVREADAVVVTRQLDGQATERLLEAANESYRTKTEDLLLAALVRTMTSLYETVDLPVGLERHGREEIDASLDLSRSVGWFASYFPVSLPGSDASDPNRLIPAVKECLRAVPAAGLGFGALRFLHPDEGIRRRLGDHGMPDILFNYSGRLDNLSARDGTFTVQGSLFGARAARNHLTHALEINAFVDGTQLAVVWKSAEAAPGGIPVETVSERFT
ncbi:MAG: hypothetical protein HKN17_07710, partial [Rhodothermales bacterium]|nr:hypothetical protein [Rhodothermales bacterium]